MVATSWSEFWKHFYCILFLCGFSSTRKVVLITRNVVVIRTFTSGSSVFVKMTGEAALKCLTIYPFFDFFSVQKKNILWANRKFESLISTFMRFLRHGYLKLIKLLESTVCVFTLNLWPLWGFPDTINFLLWKKIIKSLILRNKGFKILSLPLLSPSQIVYFLNFAFLRLYVVKHHYSYMIILVFFIFLSKNTPKSSAISFTMYWLLRVLRCPK